jgi:hypothetical protein
MREEVPAEKPTTVRRENKMGHRFELSKTTSSGIRETFQGSWYLRPHGMTWNPSEYHFHTPADATPDALTPCGCMVWRNTEGITVRCALLNKPDPAVVGMSGCNPAACALMTAHRMWSDDEPRPVHEIFSRLRARGLWVHPYRSWNSRALFGSVLTVDPGDGTRLQVSKMPGGMFIVVSYPVTAPLVEWTEDRF